MLKTGDSSEALMQDKQHYITSVFLFKLCFANAASIQHAVDKFWAPYIYIEEPDLLPLNERGWMGVTWV